MPHGAEKAAFRESPKPLHVNFQGGIIHHFLCAPTIRVPAICMADKNQQLVPVRLLKFDVFFIAHLGVLETVNDVKIGAFMLIHSFTKLGHRLTVKQLETAVYLGHVETAERVLHGEARTLFEAVISHPPKLCQLFTKLLFPLPLLPQINQTPIRSGSPKASAHAPVSLSVSFFMLTASVTDNARAINQYLKSVK